MKPSRREAGFSLVEILIALALTLTVLAAVFTLLQRGQASFRREPEVADLNQNTRNGLDMIARDLSLAGYNTPATHALLWADGGGINPDEITIMYADPEVPISEPMKCSASGGGPCGTIDQSSILNIDPATFEPPQANPELAYQDGMILFALETGDCNADGQVGLYPFQLTQPPRLTMAGGTSTLQLNHNPAAQSGINLPGGFNRQISPDCAVIGRFRSVQYRVNPPPPTANPQLERRDLGMAEPWVPVSNNIENLQVQYAVGSSNVFLDVPAMPNVSDPTTWITRVRVSVAGRSQSANLEGGSPGVFAQDDTHMRRTFSTTVSIRNSFFAGGGSTGQTYN